MTPTRLFDFIHYQKANYPQAKAVGARNDAGEWEYYSTDDIIEKANKVSRGLLKMGVKPGDKVALVVYKNRPEWVIMDIGIQQIGAINVPVYPTISPDDYNYIFNDAGVKLCVAGIGDLYDKVNAIIDEVSTLESIYTFDRHEGRLYWEDIFSDEGQEEVEKIMASIDPEEMATIIYTSGTTGNPKGVMLSHRNIASNVVPVRDLIPANQGDIALSFLPLCHIFERTAIYAFVNKGINVAFTGTDNLGGETGDLQSVRPHYFNTVPRLLEKVYEKIYNKGLELTGAKKSLFFWALSLTDTYDYDMKPSGLDAIKWSIADKLIFSKWRAALGGRVKGVLTGAAPCPVKIMRVFSAAGIPVREAYGLTETSPGLTLNRFEPKLAVMGTVGQPFPSVEIKIDTEGDYREGEGEILAKGPNIMMGYYNKPEATAEVIEESNGERWFRTGDVGTWVTGPNGGKYVKITDRKKELLKTSGGKYVAPAPIESLFKEDFLVEHIMVVGDKRKFVSALIVPAEEALKNYCVECGVSWSDMNDAINHPTVRARYQQLVDQLNPKFSKIEKIKKFRLIPTSWEAVKVDGSDAELTPTMKLKRRVILEKYAREIEELYDV
jgi:long-chain acyl-CoA synthetase